MLFYTAQGERQGGFEYFFESPQQYRLLYCNSISTNFPTALPSETDKVWTITLTRSSGSPRIVIHCNNEEVLDVVLSDATCDESSWSNQWSKDVGRIVFVNHFFASNHSYRPGKHFE